LDAGQNAQLKELGAAEDDQRAVEDDQRAVEEDLRDGEIHRVSEALALPGAHQRKRRVELASGRICIAKPQSGIADWPYAAHCEAAAWIVARWLELWELVPVTVLRDLELPEGGTEPAALQQWLEPYDADRLEAFPQEELDWAAVVDYLIAQTDRDGHNFLVRRDEHGRPHLQLPDNGYAFGAPNRTASSQFTRDRRGRPLTPKLLAAVRRLKDPAFAAELEELLPRESVSALLERVDVLLEQRRLP
jgi:hypothetical protein